MSVPEIADYWLTRFCFQRALGFIYFIALLIALNQWLPLLGEKGLVPVRQYLRRVRFWQAPSLFWLNCSDRFTIGLIGFGLILSILAMTGVSDAHGIGVSVAVWGLLWMIYLSLVNVGQIFYGFAWETLLLETGFLAIFLGSSDTRPPVIVIWLLLGCRRIGNTLGSSISLPNSSPAIAGCSRSSRKTRFRTNRRNSFAHDGIGIASPVFANKSGGSERSSASISIRSRSMIQVFETCCAGRVGSTISGNVALAVSDFGPSLGGRHPMQGATRQ
jgi:hypothetical protein